MKSPMSSSLPRSLVSEMIQAALSLGEARFARQAALAWLAVYPGDLPISLLHAEAALEEARQVGAPNGASAARRSRRFERPIALLHVLCIADPEYLPAQELLARLLFETRSAGISQGEARFPAAGRPMAHSADTLRLADVDTFGDVLVLGGRLQPGMPVPVWGDGLRQARQILASSGSITSSRADHGLTARGRARRIAGDETGAWEDAERLVHGALLRNPSTPLAAVTHLLFESARDLPLPAMRSLASVYHQRWPDCVQFTLLLADTWMDSGEEERAVALLHQAAAGDITGQVACRLWGDGHPYRALWPDRLEAPVLQDLPVPAAVAAALGWNQLPAGSSISSSGDCSPVPEPDPRSHSHPISTSRQPPSHPTPDLPGFPSPHLEMPLSIQTELEQIAARLKQPQLGRVDGRFPVYVIFTTRRGLQAQYGADAAGLVEEGMLRLAKAVRQRKGWGALLFYADEGLAIPGPGPLACLREKRARSNDAWSLKLSLADLDVALGKQGEMIGALLIVGGPEVVPFHHLPNPVDDADHDVPSDNPYATRDENYFIPEWPHGRLPGGAGSDPGFLIGALLDIANRHEDAVRRKPFFLRWWEELRGSWGASPWRMHPSLGYTAAVWRQASQAVFRPAGGGRDLLVSPPVQAGETRAGYTGIERRSDASCQPAPQRRAAGNNGNGRSAFVRLRLRPSRLGYFNLHGLPDAVEWFGQRDPSGPLDGPDYPVALRPQDLDQSVSRDSRDHGGRSPQVIFTEACYGAHIRGKGVDEALALKFLASGSQAIAGSTCIAYGAIADPLTAADLLGHSFWKFLGQGLPAGEALRRAKIHLAREMHHRQGYLDGEDQKTLISFVLYGDPLAQPLRIGRGPKTVLRPLHPPAQVKTVCDRSLDGEGVSPIPTEVLHYVKGFVAQYLPGMADAQVSLSQQHAVCTGAGHRCPTSQIGPKSRPALSPHRQVVTLQKSVPANGTGHTRLHHHYARLTLDDRGKVVKLVVSR